MNIIQYIPIGTTLFCVYFFIVLFQHWRSKPQAYHVMWWMIGVLFYGAGTVTESWHTLYGYSNLNFRLWYIFGALLGGAPLAQGTVYLLLRKSRANRLSIVLTLVIAASALFVLMSPLHPERITDGKLSGKILDWTFIRFMTPFINLYAFIFLVGGAIYSAVQYARSRQYLNRFRGNLFIAIGGLLPGIGGSFTKFGHVEVLYVTEFVGICFIYAGYAIIRNDHSVSVHEAQQERQAGEPSTSPIAAG